MSDSLQPDSKQLPDRANLRQVFRRFQAALAQIEDFDRFSDSLENLLRELPELEGIVLERKVEKEPFPQLVTSLQRRQLVLPLTGSTGLLGTLSLSASGPRRRLGAQDMQLLSALAGLTSTLLDLSYRWHQHEDWEQVIQRLFDSLPVGLILVSPRDNQPRLNQWSRRYFEGDKEDADPPSGPLPLILQALENDSADFHLKIEDTLLFVKIFGASPEDPASPRIALLYDLTRERNRIQEALVRECYRCNWKQLPLSLLLIQAPVQEELLQARQPQLEKALPETAIAGPVDAQTLALILPETHSIQARNWLRKHRHQLPVLELNIGLSALSQNLNEGLELLENAYQTLETHHDFLRYRIALEDRYEPVNDTISLVLEAHFHEVRNGVLPAPHTLPEQQLDGLVLDLKDFPKVEAACARAAAINPDFKLLLTTADETAMPPEIRKHSFAHLLTKPFGPEEVKMRFQQLWN